MSVPQSIDALDFARNASTCHGKIALSELARLEDYLIENSGELQYGIAGAVNSNAKPVLRLSIRGRLKLKCQRCLGELEHVLDIQTELLLAKDEKELLSLDEDESVEGILAEANLDVLALIEDEVILGLPVSPRHDECAGSVGSKNDVELVEEKSPFAALAALKKIH